MGNNFNGERGAGGGRARVGGGGGAALKLYCKSYWVP